MPSDHIGPDLMGYDEHRELVKAALEREDRPVTLTWKFERIQHGSWRASCSETGEILENPSEATLMEYVYRSLVGHREPPLSVRLVESLERSAIELEEHLA